MGKINFLELKKLLPELRKDVLLKNYTTFKIGGPAKYFYVAKTKKDLIKALRAAKKFNLPFFILGGGSKLLVSDNGYDGIVIKVNNEQRTTNNNIIFAEAGTRLADLVKLSLKESLTGLEWAVGIPGTLGGAIFGNAGAFGKYISDAIKEVEVLDIKDFRPQTFNNQECLFEKKQSIFKQNKDIVILSAKIELSQGRKKDIKEKIEEHLVYRNQTQPLGFASAGCIFQNQKSKRNRSLSLPVIASQLNKNQKLLEKFPKLKESNQREVPSGFLIDRCGLKGKRIGDAKISEKHANFIINLGNAKASDVIKLIELAKNKVKEKFSIEFKEEIYFLTP